jgi:uncharacterized protein
MTEAEIESPCIGVCSMDESTGFCLGCYRSADEISDWLDLDHAQKKAIITATQQREAQAFD